MKNLTKLKSLFVAVFLLLGTSLMAQTISGTISSEDGPLPGATIIVKGTNNGTTSDFDGNFSIDASSSDVLVISFVGFVSQEVSVGDNDQLTVSLVSDTELEEIVVTGYGSQREKEISSAVTKITAEEFNKGPISSAAGLLEGAVAGLSIYSKGGNPNAGSTIRLRGISTLGGNVSPLFVIDGIPGASIDNLDPQDIETINVLKDGSAAAIYGSQGSSGVIIVTTKKGTPGKMRISYSGEYSVAEKMNAIQILVVLILEPVITGLTKLLVKESLKITVFLQQEVLIKQLSELLLILVTSRVLLRLLDLRHLTLVLLCKLKHLMTSLVLI
jgi:TonB-dependent SusC/RagA subfamily outer membrane receptor